MATTEAIQRINDLKRSPEYVALKPKQAAFVMAIVHSYVDTGALDLTKATLAAYDCKDEAAARRFSYELIAHPKILRALSAFFEGSIPADLINIVERAASKGRLTTTQIRILQSLLKNLGGPADAVARVALIAEVQRQLEAAEPGSIAATSLLAQLERLFSLQPTSRATSKHSVEAKAGVQAFPIGTLIEQDGVRYRVEAVEVER